MSKICSLFLLRISLHSLWSKVIHRCFFHKKHVYLDAPSRQRWSHFATICSILHAFLVWIKLASKSSIYLKVTEITGKQNDKILRKSSRHFSKLPTQNHFFFFFVIKRSTGTLGRPFSLTEDINICNTTIPPAQPVFPAWCFWLVHVDGHSADMTILMADNEPVTSVVLFHGFWIFQQEKAAIPSHRKALLYFNLGSLKDKLWSMYR